MNNELATLSINFIGNINQLKNDIKALKSEINSVGNVKVKDIGIKNVSNNFKKGSQNIRNEVDKTKKSINSLSSSFKGLSRLGKFFAFTYVGRQLANFTSKLITSGANLTEIENLFQVSFGNMAKSAEEFANKLEKAWGINAVVTKEQTSYLNNMYKALGFTEQGAYDLSTGLVQLSYNMASLFNKDQVQILNALRGATVGLSRPIKSFGIETGVAKLQEVALRKGIISTTREMTRQEKVLATYWAIYEQTESAWKSGTATIDGQTVAIGDMTKTISSNANMMRVIKDQLKSITYWWGLAFQPILEFVLPVIYKLISALVSLGKTFALFVGKMFGLTSLSEMINKFGSSGAIATEDIEDGFGDVGDSIDNTKKKLKGLIGGFDELNVRQQDSGGGSVGGIGGGIENDIGMPNLDEIVGETILQKVDEQIKKIFDSLTKLKEPIQKFMDFLLGLSLIAGIIGGIVLLVKNFSTLVEIITMFKSLGFGMTLSALFPQFSALAASIGLTSTALLGIIAGVAAFVAVFVAGFIYLFSTSEEFRNKIIGLVSGIIEKITSIGETLRTKFIEPVIEIFKQFITEIWDNGLSELIDNISTFVLLIIDVLLGLLNWLLDIALPVIVGWIKNTMDTIKPIVIFITGIVNSILNIFNGLLLFLKGDFKGGWELIFKGIGNFCISIFNGIVGAIEWAINKVIQGVNTVIKLWNDNLGDILSWAGINLRANLVNDVKFGRIPQLADGGIVSSPTIVEVGEYAGARNNPEVIAPLNDLKGYIGENSNGKQISLLEEQNELLRKLLRKPSGITKGEIEDISYNHMKRESNRTGDLLFG